MIDCWQNQFLFSENSFSEELTSCWFLTSCFLLATSQVFSDENRQLPRRAWPLRKLVRQGAIVAESRRWVSNMKMSILLKKGWLYRAAQKKCPILFFIPIFSIFFTADLGDSFETNMDPSGRYTTQQRMKIIEEYFAAKSVLLTKRQCRKKNFGKNNVPNGRTIQRLVAKFQKKGSVADAHKGQDRSSFGIIPKNIQNLRECQEDFPRNVFQKKAGILRTSFLRIFHDDLQLFPYKIQILHRQTEQNKAEQETILWRYQSKDWKWAWLVGFERFERCWPLWTLLGICYTSCLSKFDHQTLNCPSAKYIVPAKVSPALPLCQKNWFCRKVRFDDFLSAAA